MIIPPFWGVSLDSSQADGFSGGTVEFCHINGKLGRWGSPDAYGIGIPDKNISLFS
jgi:hypothetical protein